MRSWSLNGSTSNILSILYAPFNQIIIFFEFTFEHVARTQRTVFAYKIVPTPPPDDVRLDAVRVCGIVCCWPARAIDSSAWTNVWWITLWEQWQSKWISCGVLFQLLLLFYLYSFFLLLWLSSWCKHRSFPIIRLVNGIVCPILTNNTFHIRFELLCAFFLGFFFVILFSLEYV